jgi:DNA polymerase-3 subunit delta
MIKYKNSNASYFDLEDFNFKKFVNLTQTIPFLAEERLIIIRDLLEIKNTITKDKIIKYLDSIPKSTIVLFYENKQPKKNNKLYKYLIKNSFCYEFSQMESYELIKYANIIVKKYSLNITNDALIYLLEKSRNDLWKISNEIIKLSNFDKTINKEDVEELVSDKKFDNILSMNRNFLNNFSNYHL